MKKLLLILITLMSTTLQAKDLKVLNLTSENTVSITTEFSQRSVAKVVKEVYRLDNKLTKGKPIYLVLNSPGGSVVAGLWMYNLLKALDRPIHTVTMFAASMGFHTVQNLGKRYILPHGILMSHLATGGVKGTIPGSSNVKLSFWSKMISDMDKIVVDRTKGKWTLKKYKEMVKTEYWSNGQNAVDDGFADEVVLAKCEYKMVEKNKCPLIP